MTTKAERKPISELFGTDENLEKKGIVIDYGAYGKFTVARMGGKNKRFSRLLREKMKPYMRQFQAGLLQDDIANKIQYETFAATVVIGWEDVLDDDGKEIKFSPKACVELFEKFPDLFLDIQGQAQELALFRTVNLEEDAKN